MSGTQANVRRERLVSRDPLTGAELGDYPVMSAVEVRGLVAAARRAQADWSQRPLHERVQAMQRLRRLVADRADGIARAIRAETGKVLGDGWFEVVIVCEGLAFIARHASSVLLARRAEPAFFAHRRARVAYEPYGVIGIITPWNYPFVIAMGAVTAALTAGNGAVLKPSEQTPGIGALIVELVAEATGHEDLVQLATGDGSTGAALVEAGVDKVAFTGSTSSGKKVMETAAKVPIPVVLELGGKDAMIVCADADLERAARGAVWGAFHGCGQVCMAVERVYAVDAIYDDFVGAVVRQARRVSAGDEPEAMVGSLIAEFQRDKVEAHVRDAREKGARALLGGRPLEGPGYFYAPTVLTDVDHEMAVMREETFGPVLPIMRVADEREAVQLANDTAFGLDASVWTSDRGRGRHIARQLKVGAVLVNDHLINYAFPDLPFGGIGASGFGRVHGLEGLREFVRPKAWVEDRFRLSREIYWFEEGGSGIEMSRDVLTLRHGQGPLRRLRAGLRLLRRLTR
ncbi:MAG: aldehyde dehydrogenase family protein [Gemmatimonadetes bacterium]|nr:aldehyde dehydrogenase family protein [Gemmatimonadota bacterium]